MTVVVVIEAVVLLVLGLVVAGLLASYSGLNERIRRVEGRAPQQRLPPDDFALTPVEGHREDGTTVLQLVGRTPLGDEVILPTAGVDHDLLVAFLSSGCTSCGSLWADLREGRLPVLPAYLRLVVVTRGVTDESPAAIADLAPDDIDVLMSTEIWEDFSTPGSPYFAYVEGATGRVVGEGTALSWTQVLALVATSSGDAAVVSETGRDLAKPRSDRDRENGVDLLLLNAGILPGDPSLYPTPAIEVALNGEVS